MIDEKYIELMNLEIDQVITPDEKIRLHSYLSENKEAREYYDELLLTSDSLNQLPDHEPSENLKKQTINSIDFSKYSPKARHSSIRSYGWVFKFRYAYTFAAGIIAGLFIYSLFTMGSGNINQDDISGTIGIISNAKTIEEIPLNFPDMQGTITIKEQGESFWFSIYSNSSQPVDFVITYPDQVKFENIKPGKSGDINLSSGKNYIKTTNSGSQQYSVMFTKSDITPSPLHFRLLQSGKTLYTCELSLNR